MVCWADMSALAWHIADLKSDLDAWYHRTDVPAVRPEPGHFTLSDREGFRMLPR
jgi:hypothetical protein